MEIIKNLKERAEEMLKNNNKRKIGAEEIYTIICEWEDVRRERDSLMREAGRLHEENSMLKKHLDCVLAESKENKESKQMEMLTEIKEMLLRMQFYQEKEKLDERYKEQEQIKERAEQEMGYINSEKMHKEFAFYNRRS